MLICSMFSTSDAFCGPDSARIDWPLRLVLSLYSGFISGVQTSINSNSASLSLLFVKTFITDNYLASEPLILSAKNSSSPTSKKNILMLRSRYSVRGTHLQIINKGKKCLIRLLEGVKLCNLRLLQLIFYSIKNKPL